MLAIWTLRINGQGTLKTMMIFKPFIKWGLDFMGLTKPSTNYTNN
jgi:hypothetical protein